MSDTPDTLRGDEDTLRYIARLERELSDLRAKLAEAENSVNAHREAQVALSVTVKVYEARLAAMVAENAELKASLEAAEKDAERDAERLDWLEQCMDYEEILNIVAHWTFDSKRYPEGMRGAIDAAIEKGKLHEWPHAPLWVDK